MCLTSADRCPYTRGTTKSFALPTGHHYRAIQHMGADVWESIKLLQGSPQLFLVEWISGDIPVPTDVGRSCEALARLRSEEYCRGDSEYCTLKGIKNI